MYTALLHTHSTLRYLVLLLLIAVVVKSLIGWRITSTYDKTDNRLSLGLLILTHTQFLVGLFLYFVSPFVQFAGTTMKDHTIRYWTIEHVFMMVIAVALITIARTTHKKLTSGRDKQKRLFILNSIALLIIVVAIVYSGRGLIGTMGAS